MAELPPDELSPGVALRISLGEELPEGARWDRREVAILDRVEHLADRISALEASIERDGVTVSGSRDQVVAHPALPALVAAEALLIRCLRQLSFEVEDETPAQRRARRAATSRYARRGH